MKMIILIVMKIWIVILINDNEIVMIIMYY